MPGEAGDTGAIRHLFSDRKTGKPLWPKTARQQVPHDGHHRDHGFACFGSFGLYCYDMKGHLQWEKDPRDMQTRNSLGAGTSPAPHGETIVVQ